MEQQKGVSQQPQFKGKDFLTLSDFHTDEILYLLDEAKELKSLQKQGKPHPYLSGKVLGMIFEKSSTRTRVSFEVGMLQLGGHAIFLSSKDIQIGRGESISDTAKVLSRYIDCMMIRTFSHNTVEELAEHATVPVINGLTDLHHPTQVMADLLTIQEHKGKLAGLKMCYLGDGNNNMAHSLMEGAAKVGMHISIASPLDIYQMEKLLKRRLKRQNKQAVILRLQIIRLKQLKMPILSSQMFGLVWVKRKKRKKD